MDMAPEARDGNAASSRALYFPEACGSIPADFVWRILRNFLRRNIPGGSVDVEKAFLRVFV